MLSRSLEDNICTDSNKTPSDDNTSTNKITRLVKILPRPSGNNTSTNNNKRPLEDNICTDSNKRPLNDNTFTNNNKRPLEDNICTNSNTTPLNSQSSLEDLDIVNPLLDALNNMNSFF